MPSPRFPRSRVRRLLALLAQVVLDRRDAKRDAPAVRVRHEGCAASARTTRFRRGAATRPTGGMPLRVRCCWWQGHRPTRRSSSSAPADGASAPLDTGAVDQATATLFGRDSSRFTATLELPAGNDNAECRVWPLRNLRAKRRAGAWSVGFRQPERHTNPSRFGRRASGAGQHGARRRSIAARIRGHGEHLAGVSRAAIHRARHPSIRASLRVCRHWRRS